MSLPVNLKNDILNPNMNGHRKFNIVDENGDVVLQNVRIQDVSSYLQVGSTIDADVVNEQNAAINALEDVPDDISAINSSLGYFAETGKKNILPFPYYDMPTGGIFVVNADGTITINGTSTSNSNVRISRVTTNFAPPTGKYIVSKGFAQTGVTFFIQGYNGDTFVRNLNTSDDDNVEVTIDYNGYDRIITYIQVNANVTVNNKKAYPMMRLVGTSASFQSPATQTNAALTENVTPRNLSSDVQIGDATSISNLVVYRTGKIVNVYGYISATFTANTDLIVCSLPFECTPSGNHAVRFLCAVGDNAYSPAANVAYGIISGTGQFKINTSLSGSKEAYFCVSYIAAS